VLVSSASAMPSSVSSRGFALSCTRACTVDRVFFSFLARSACVRPLAFRAFVMVWPTVCSALTHPQFANDEQMSMGLFVIAELFTCYAAL